MPLYLVHPSDIIFVKGYGFLSFAKEIRKNIAKSINKNLLIMQIQSTADTLKAALKTEIPETAESNGNLIGKKMSMELQKC